MKHTEIRPENTHNNAFAFVDYTDAELIAFYELIRNHVRAAVKQVTDNELPGIAGKYNLLLSRI